MLGNQLRSMFKNENIQRGHVELSAFRYDIVHRQARDKTVADTLSQRVCASISGRFDL